MNKRQGRDAEYNDSATIIDAVRSCISSYSAMNSFGNDVDRSDIWT